MKDRVRSGGYSGKYAAYKNYGRLNRMPLRSLAMSLLPFYFMLLLWSCDSVSLWDYLNLNLISSRITIDESALTVDETGATAAFYVSINEQPTAPVRILVTLADSTEAAISTTLGDIIPPDAEYTAAHLEFTPENWKTDQQVVIVGMDDGEADNAVVSTISIECISTDTRYNGFSLEPLTITSLDNEIGSYYTYAVANPGTYNSIASTGGTSIWSGNSFYDNEYYTIAFPTDFKFNFNGTIYSAVYISINGFLTFCPSGLNTTDNTLLFSPTFPVIPQNMIAPWWDDLSLPRHLVATSQVYYQMTGTLPNRVLSIEWYELALLGDINTRFNFQVKLHESTNIIRLIYGAQTGPTEPTASSGLKGRDILGPDFIDGTTGSDTTGNAMLGLTDFPPLGTIITFTPK